MTVRAPLESEQTHYYNSMEQLNVIATYSTSPNCTKEERNRIFHKNFNRFLRQRSKSNNITDHLFNSIDGHCRYDLRIRPGPDMRPPSERKPAPVKPSGAIK
jgi:hypothetical protein